MAVHVTVHDDAVVIRFGGLDRVLALSSGLRLPISEVTGARVAPVAEVRQGLGWRVGGGYWPHRLATGWFTVPDRRGARQLWCAYRDTEVLVIDTMRERPCRIVLQHPDRNDLAWYIGERLSPPAP